MSVDDDAIAVCATPRIPDEIRPAASSPKEKGGLRSRARLWSDHVGPSARRLPDPGRRQLKTIGVVVASAAAIFLAFLLLIARAGSAIFDTQLRPQPSFVPQLVDGMVAVNEGIRAVAPFVAVGALAVAGYYLVAGIFDQKKRTLNRHSLIEYSGAEEIQNRPRRPIQQFAVYEWGRTLTRSIGITVLAVMLVSATSGVEHEVTNGPLRPIKSLASQFGSDNRGYTLLLQSRNVTLMDDSVIPEAAMTDIVRRGEQLGVTVIPFGKALLTINGRSAIEFSVPDELFSRLTGFPINESCEKIPMIVDSTVKTDDQGDISINGVSAQPVGHRADIAQMNRSIAFLADTSMKKCIKQQADAGYFGAFVTEASPTGIQDLLAAAQSFGIAAVNDSDFEENNRKFWRANGTPILLQMMAYIAIFGAAAAAAQRRNALQRNIKEIGILNASGVSMKEIRSVEDRRALWETLYATALAAPFIPALAAAFNAAELGMQVGVGLRELAVGLSLTLVAKVFASRIAVSRIAKNINLPQAVKA